MASVVQWESTLASGVDDMFHTEGWNTSVHTSVHASEWVLGLGCSQTDCLRRDGEMSNQCSLELVGAGPVLFSEVHSIEKSRLP